MNLYGNVICIKVVRQFRKQLLGLLVSYKDVNIFHSGAKHNLELNLGVLQFKTQAATFKNTQQYYEKYISLLK